MSEALGTGEEVIGHMIDPSWLDDESVPASWLYHPDGDPGQYDEPAPATVFAGEISLAAASQVAPAADESEPPADDSELTADDFEPTAEPPWWLTDEFCGTPDQEHAAWLASLPADIRADYLSGPDTGAEEDFAPGFTHHEGGGPAGAGFAAGGLLDQMLPGQSLARALTEAARQGYDQLTDSEQIGVLCGWQRQAAWAQAGLAATAVAVVRRRDAQAAATRNPHLSEYVRDEIAVPLVLTPLSAGRLLAAGTGLDRLPEVAKALSTGQIDWPKACIFADELLFLDAELARGIAAWLLAAGRLTTSQLRARLRRAVLAADPDAARRRQKEGRTDTRVEVWDEPSGNGVLAGRELAPADVIAADAQLTADAAWLRRHGMSGTAAELRAAAFIARLSGRDLATLLPAPADNTADAASGNSDGAQGASVHGHRADSAPDACSVPGARPVPGGTINLTLPLSAYAGLDDSPGEADGYGAIDADTGRDLATRLGRTTRWCLTVTGPDGRAVAHACARPGHAPEPGTPAIRWAAGLRDRLQFLEAGACTHARQTASYAWPASLRHLIETRQRTCAAPGCRRPARRCDIDHTIPYDNGGPTCECNGAPLCRKHHRCKQSPGWRLSQHQPGLMTWRLPGGRIYETVGDPY